MLKERYIETEISEEELQHMEDQLKDWEEIHDTERDDMFWKSLRHDILNLTILTLGIIAYFFVTQIAGKSRPTDRRQLGFSTRMSPTQPTLDIREALC